MVNVEKDERKVEIVGHEVVFSYENIQKYTFEQAKNVYVSMFYDLKAKEKNLEIFETMKNQRDKSVEEEINTLRDALKKSYPRLTPIQLKHWKDIQMMQTHSEFDIQMEKVRKEVKNLKVGLLIWRNCKDLPETEHELKLKEKFNQNE